MESDWEFDLLDYSQRNLFIFPILPDSTVSVDLSGNNFRNIGTLPNKIQYLDLSNNNIRQTKQLLLLKGLRTLNLSGNNFKELPDLSKNIKSLDVSYNNIRTINYKSLPKHLKYLNISGNKISDINFDILPRGIHCLDIRYINISVLFVPRNWSRRIIASDNMTIISNILEYKQYNTYITNILYGLITERGILKLIVDYM